MFPHHFYWTLWLGHPPRRKCDLILISNVCFIANRWFFLKSDLLSSTLNKEEWGGGRVLFWSALGRKRTSIFLSMLLIHIQQATYRNVQMSVKLVRGGELIYEIDKADVAPSVTYLSTQVKQNKTAKQWKHGLHSHFLMCFSFFFSSSLHCEHAASPFLVFGTQ